MNEKIKVWGIAIERNKIIIYPEEEKVKVFERENYELFAENIRQLHTFRNYSVILPGEPYFCEVDKDKGRIFCGKEPEKVKIL